MNPLPNLVVSLCLTISSPNTTLTGGTYNEDLVLTETADNCTISGVTFSGSLYVNGADNSVVKGCTFNGPFLWVGHDDAVTGFILSNCSFPYLGGLTADGHNYPVVWGNGLTVGVDQSKMMFCTLNGTALTTNGGLAHWTEVFKNVTNFTRRGNKETWVTAPTSGSFTIRLRDNCGNWAMNCDTIIVSGPDEGLVHWSTKGSDGDSPPSGLVVDSCLVNLGGCQGGGETLFGFGVSNSTLSRTTIIAPTRALYIPTAAGLTVNHCTLVSAGDQGVVQVGRDKSEDLPPFGNNALTLTDNLIALLAPFNVESLSGCGTSQRVGTWYEKAHVDPNNEGTSQNNITAHHNFHTYWGYSSTPGDHSIFINAGDGNCTFWAGLPISSSPTYSVLHLESDGSYGSAKFVDSLLTTFNPRITANSHARYKASDGMDAGAFQYSTSGGGCHLCHIDPAPSRSRTSVRPGAYDVMGRRVDLGIGSPGIYWRPTQTSAGRVVQLTKDGEDAAVSKDQRSPQ